MSRLNLNKPTTIYLMHYQPANSTLGEGLVALYEQKLAASLGYTNSDIGYAAAIQNFGQNNITSLGHSRGTLVQNNAFNILQQQGFTNPNLSVRGVGGALPVGVLSACPRIKWGQTRFIELSCPHVRVSASRLR